MYCTPNFNRAAKGQKFHGLEKLHLNNSVQDGTLMNEMICADLFLAAGVPTARATHALVQINNRKLGLYVLKEGYDEKFLKRHFARPDGNLYDGGFLTDIDQPLKRSEGKSPETRLDLRALAAAAHERDLDKRMSRLETRLDVDRFFSLAALEMLACDWDGYVQKSNNYRLYFDPATGKAVFIPHGKDQMFWWSDFPIMPEGGGLVARQLMEVPEFHERYVARLGSLITNVFTAASLTNSVNRIEARLRKNLADLPQLVDYVALQHRGMCDRLVDRARNVREQFASLPKPLQYDAEGTAAITGWQPRQDSGSPTLQPLRESSHPEQLLIRAGSGPTVASWRARVKLGPGNYRFTGRVQTTDVVPVKSQQGEGAGLRLSGQAQSETSRVSGTVKDHALRYEFRLDGEREVEFIVELRASRGEARFDLGSLRLQKR